MLAVTGCTPPEIRVPSPAQGHVQGQGDSENHGQGHSVSLSCVSAGAGVTVSSCDVSSVPARTYVPHFTQSTLLHQS